MTAQAPAQIELNLGHFCNNRCVFCVSGQLTERGQAGRSALDGLKAQLDAAGARKAGTVTLLGGEPTLHPHFPELLDHALGCGFDEIVIFTNGARTGDREWIASICEKGRFTWRFSIQGGTREAHDRTTKRKGAWDRIVHGLEVLQELGQRTTVNLCVNGVNVASLPELPPVLGRYGVEQFHADMVRPHSVGDRTEAELDDLVVPYAEVATHLRAMLARFAAEAPEVEVRIGNLPFCVLPEEAWRIEHGGVQTDTVTADERGEELEKAWDKYAYQRSHRTHPEGCAGCAYRDRCVGVPDAYLARHGGGGFLAIAAQPHPDLPSPAAHLAGTRRVIGRFARLARGTAWLEKVGPLLEDPPALPVRASGLKADAYFSVGPRGVAWGFTVNSRWDPDALERFGLVVAELGADYAWDRVAPFWERLGGVLTLGVGFDRPDAPPRLKLYAQEDEHGVGVTDGETLRDLVDGSVPDWLGGRRIDVVTLQLHPDGRTSYKAYVGGPTPAEAAAGAPELVQQLATRMARLSPLEPAWYYMTARLEDEPRYAMNKIYPPNRWLLEGPASEPWRDVASLFAGAGKGAHFKRLLAELLKLDGVTVLPTATAVEDGGRSVDVYCAGWAR